MTSGNAEQVRADLSKYIQRLTRRYKVEFVVIREPHITDLEGDLYEYHNWKATIAPACCRVPITLIWRSYRNWTGGWRRAS